jgi:hypothetical protein
MARGLQLVQAAFSFEQPDTHGVLQRKVMDKMAA